MEIGVDQLAIYGNIYELGRIRHDTNLLPGRNIDTDVFSVPNNHPNAHQILQNRASEHFQLDHAQLRPRHAGISKQKEHQRTILSPHRRKTPCIRGIRGDGGFVEITEQVFTPRRREAFFPASGGFWNQQLLDVGPHEPRGPQLDDSKDF